jgi:hypothetical protein
MIFLKKCKLEAHFFDFQLFYLSNCFLGFFMFNFLFSIKSNVFYGIYFKIEKILQVKKIFITFRP